MTREDLLRLIARAVRRSFTFASEGQALGAADTVLRDLKAVGVRILAPRRRTPSRAMPSSSARPDGSSGRRLEEPARDAAASRLPQSRRTDRQTWSSEPESRAGPGSPRRDAQD
jgi:hypothetical protein